MIKFKKKRVVLLFLILVNGFAHLKALDGKPDYL